jgi:hypothetical protein
VNVNDDSGLEKEADVMGAKALQMKASAPNLVLNEIQIQPIVAQRAELEWDELKHVKPGVTDPNDKETIRPLIETYNQYWFAIGELYKPYNQIKLGNNPFGRTKIRKDKIEKLRAAQAKIQEGITALGQDDIIEEKEATWKEKIISWFQSWIWTPEVPLDWRPIRDEMVDSLRDLDREVLGQITYQEVKIAGKAPPKKSVKEGASDVMDEWKADQEGAKESKDELFDAGEDIYDTAKKLNEGDTKGLLDKWNEETTEQQENFTKENAELLEKMPDALPGKSYVSIIVEKCADYGAAFIAPVIKALLSARSRYKRFKAFSTLAQADAKGATDDADLIDAHLHGRAKSLRALADSGMELTMKVTALISWIFAATGVGSAVTGVLQGIKKTYGSLRTAGHAMKAAYKIMKGTRGQHREQSATTIYDKAKGGDESSQQLIRDLDVVTFKQNLMLPKEFKGKAIGTVKWIDKLEAGEFVVKQAGIEMGLSKDDFMGQLTDAWASHV